MARKLGLLVCLLVSAVSVTAQVVDAKVCDILAHPTSFDGKTVRITGTVVAGFDEFVIRDTSCKQAVNAIWLSYPSGTKAKAGPAAVITLQLAKNSPGQPATVARTPVTLEQSKDFKQFDSILSTPARTSGRCLGCIKSTLTATLTGRLDAVEKPTLERDAKSMFTEVSGFGNLNRYAARLVLQSVANVTANEIDYSKPAGLGDGNVDLGIAADQVQRAVGAYGKEGDNNGVGVGFGGGNAVPPGDGSKGSDASPDGLILMVTFDSDRLKGPAMSEAMAHTGAHIADLRESPSSRNLFQLEAHGWGVTVMSAIATGEKMLVLPGGYVAWNSGWSAEDKQMQIPGAVSGFLTDWAGLAK